MATNYLFITGDLSARSGRMIFDSSFIIVINRFHPVKINGTEFLYKVNVYLSKGCNQHQNICMYDKKNTSSV